MYKIISFLLLITLVSACKKPLNDVNDYFPKVSLVSAVLQTDGTVLVTGNIDSEGAAAIEYFGFCCSTRKEPQMLDRQLLGSSYTNGQFTAIYSGGFNADSVYYFRVWATNDFGYAYGNSLSLSKIIAAPVTPPCTLTPNKCSLGGGEPVADFSRVSSPSLSIGRWDITATCNSGPVLSLSFGSALTTGVYTTTTATSPSAGEVYISFYSGFLSAFLKSGAKVYVNRVSSGVHTVAICNAPWNFNGGTSNFFLNAQFRTPY